ncbi:MAG: hypothetical protein ACRED0_04455 [Gammaproteobacteria bacterium]
MKITRSGGRWYCAEVVSADSFGFGTYRFSLDSPVDALDPNVVLGLFTWSDDPAYNNREIDIEFTRWGDPNNQNAQYVVQPYTLPQNIIRFDMPPAIDQSLHQVSMGGHSRFLSQRDRIRSSTAKSECHHQRMGIRGTRCTAGGWRERANKFLAARWRTTLE